jgi:hypothetical protein
VAIVSGVGVGLGAFVGLGVLVGLGLLVGLGELVGFAVWPELSEELLTPLLEFEMLDEFEVVQPNIIVPQTTIHKNNAKKLLTFFIATSLFAKILSSSTWMSNNKSVLFSQIEMLHS